MSSTSMTYVALLFLIHSVFGDTGPITRRCLDYDGCNEYNLNSGQVECKGESSCNFDCSPTCTNDTRIYSWSPRPNKGSIWCGGMESCAQADSLSSNTDFVKCQGSKSCNGGSGTFSGGNSLTIDGRGIQCDGAESCSKDNTNANSMQVILTGGLGADLECNGANSCRGPDVILDLSLKNGDAKCYGARSCKDAIVNEGGGITCSGTESCAGVDINSQGGVGCNGLGACQDITARLNNDRSRQFYSAGYRSAQNADIAGAQEVFGRGYEAFKDATIDSDGVTRMDVEMYGDSAGNGATVICRSGAVCSLTCLGNACQGLEYQCETGATCNVIPARCPVDNSKKKIKGVNCPRFTTGTSTEINNKPDDGNIHSVPDTMEIKPETSLLCGLENECAGQTIAESGETRCAGYNSCDNTQITMAGTNGTLFCSGESSCSGATIASDSSVYCSGAYGCDQASVTADDMIICDGSYGCRRADLDLGANTGVKCSGNYGCSEAAITKLRGSSGSLMCDGNMGCRYADIIYTTDIECNGYYSCVQTTTIQTSNGDLYCNGMWSCNSVNIVPGDLNKKNPSDRTAIYANGYGSAGYSTISAERIYGYGYSSLYRATISSGGLGSITVEGLGWESLIDATIICESGDTCLLKCASGACDATTNYVCLDGATCNLNPKQCLTRRTFRGIECPTISTNITTNAKWNILTGNAMDLDMELFGDIEFVNNDHQEVNMMNILLFGVIGLSLIIGVVMMYYKMNANDKYLELQ